MPESTWIGISTTTLLHIDRGSTLCYVCYSSTDVSFIIIMIIIIIIIMIIIIVKS